MTIRELMKAIHADNVDRGWWDEFKDLLPLSVERDDDVLCVTAKLCLIHSEISEALEEVRAGRPFAEVYREGVTGSLKPLGFSTELADAVIRIFDLAEACGIDLEDVIEKKLAYNRTRGHKHGGKLL